MSAVEFVLLNALFNSVFWVGVAVGRWVYKTGRAE